MSTSLRSQCLLSALAISICLLFSSPHQAVAAASTYSQYCPQMQYVDGVYTCMNFATDFQKNCQAAGQQSNVVYILGEGACSKVVGHAFNVVTAPSCDLASGLQKYCAVEPQNGNQWCWTQNATGFPKLPSWVLQSVAAGLTDGGALAACVGKGKDNYDIVFGVGNL
jgi:hypothetical protein